MATEVVIRRPQPSEYNSVRVLIETVANETFKDLFAPNPVPLKFEHEDWPLAWVAAADEQIVGVIITNQEWVSDLWVFREHRGRGVGSRLLSEGEAEIAARGHQTCRLRVVRSNIGRHPRPGMCSASGVQKQSSGRHLLAAQTRSYSREGHHLAPGLEPERRTDTRRSDGRRVPRRRMPTTPAEPDPKALVGDFYAQSTQGFPPASSRLP